MVRNFDKYNFPNTNTVNTCTYGQGRSQDFVIGRAKRKFGGGASLKNFKILNIGLRNFYVMFK